MEKKNEWALKYARAFYEESKKTKPKVKPLTWERLLAEMAFWRNYYSN